MGIILLQLCIFFSAIVIHEYAHGQVAFWLGDRTAKYEGRLTLNPLAHIDPVGTVLLPLTLILTRAPVVFGWARPVPINYWGLKNPKRDIIWVGLSGPLANIILAFCLALLIKLNLGLPQFIIYILEGAIVTNIFLALFNLIPIPPLDGSRVLFGILPSGLARQYAKLERYGFIILIGILFLFPNFIDSVLGPIVNIFLGVLN